jgi:hypothetical protein
MVYSFPVAVFRLIFDTVGIYKDKYSFWNIICPLLCQKMSKDDSYARCEWATCISSVQCTHGWEGYTLHCESQFAGRIEHPLEERFHKQQPAWPLIYYISLYIILFDKMVKVRMNREAWTGLFGLAAAEI